MTILQSLILAIVQGVAEFLPISSSGHLNLAQHFLNLTPSLTLDIFLNTATLLSVLFYFRHQFTFFKNNIVAILVGSIPAGVIGILFKSQIETIFSDIKLLPLFFLVTALSVLSTKFIKSKNEKITLPKAIGIGIVQAIAILPGVSRSGSTIFAGLLLGLSPETAFNFSFSLFIPASVGALLLDIKKMSPSQFTSVPYLLSFMVTLIVGIISLTILDKLLSKRKTWYLGIYVLSIALISFILFR